MQRMNASSIVSYCSSPDTNTFESFLHNEEDRASLSDNTILSLYIDNFDNVWIGTYEKGINKYSSTTERFKLFQPLSFAKVEVEGNNITAVLIDNKYNIWLGTNGDGIKVYHKDALTNENLIYEFKADPNLKNGLSSNNITSIIQDRGGVFWIGTFGGGLNIGGSESSPSLI